jgi:hypothetical protein
MTTQYEDFVTRVRLEGAENYTAGQRKVGEGWKRVGQEVHHAHSRMRDAQRTATGGWKGSTYAFSFDTQGAKRQLRDLENSVNGSSSRILAAGRVMSDGWRKHMDAMMVLGGVNIASGAFIYGVGRATLSMDALQRGLDATTGSAKESARQMKNLREISRLPGLDYRDAMKGSIYLQQAGMSANMAERSLMAVGNALATVGKGKAELDMVNFAMTQLMNRTSGFGQEIRQLQNHLPQIKKMMEKAFKTADPEAIGKMGITGPQFVQKLIEALEELPKVTGGLQNNVENLGTSWDTFLFGTGGSAKGGLAGAVWLADKVLIGLNKLNDVTRGVTGGIILAGAAIVAIGTSVLLAMPGLKALRDMWREIKLEAAGATVAQSAAGAAAKGAAVAGGIPIPTGGRTPGGKTPTPSGGKGGGMLGKGWQWLKDGGVFIGASLVWIGKQVVAGGKYLLKHFGSGAAWLLKLPKNLPGISRYALAWVKDSFNLMKWSVAKNLPKAFTALKNILPGIGAWIMGRRAGFGKLPAVGRDILGGAAGRAVGIAGLVAEGLDLTLGAAMRKKSGNENINFSPTKLITEMFGALGATYNAHQARKRDIRGDKIFEDYMRKGDESIKKEEQKRYGGSGGPKTRDSLQMEGNAYLKKILEAMGQQTRAIIGGGDRARTAINQGDIQRAITSSLKKAVAG